MPVEKKQLSQSLDPITVSFINISKFLWIILIWSSPDSDSCASESKRESLSKGKTKSTFTPATFQTFTKRTSKRLICLEVFAHVKEANLDETSSFFFSRVICGKNVVKIFHSIKRLWICPGNMLAKTDF